MAYKAVVFDIDGTLLDTLQDIADSSNRVLARLGFSQHETEAYKYFVGDGIEALAYRILPDGHRDKATVTEVAASIDTEYGQHWADTTHPYEGIPELLQALTIRGLKVAALSNKPDHSAKLTVSRLLPPGQFELVLGVCPSVPKKPDPAGALGIARHLNIFPNEFLYLGDTGTDMQTAAAAGMYAIGVLWGFRPADELLTNGAKALISSPLDLLGLL